MGLAALADGEQAVRQRITERTGAGPAPAVVTPPRQSIAQRLQELETLRASDAVSEPEYSAKREKIIDDL